ncbi:hypothetical protein [Oscillatoria sp. FACHB-1406]|uniref:hypothetical protein n=1 Tax=Oscillatoria sp. FACHB-1406 TaxID=2692846 RepID=UPI0016889513|nr:hypothetical protein [Oscillatoria sp. FACHB-1406]MBD2579643.1 hypothetical protein [Oscillatoria sp. FACHB-1406]
MRKFLDLIIGIALITCLLVLVSLAVPIDYPGHFNFDESIELTRVHLLKRGYIFYQEVWSDHPLGLPRTFDFFSNFIEINLPSSRRIVLFISTINIFVFYTILRLNCDRIAATTATLILI